MTFRKSRLFTEVIVTTEDTTPEEHEKQVRRLVQNMIQTNSQMPRVFAVYIVRDENSNLVQFAGVGLGQPGPDIEDILDDLSKEQPASMNLR